MKDKLDSLVAHRKQTTAQEIKSCFKVGTLRERTAVAERSEMPSQATEFDLSQVVSKPTNWKEVKLGPPQRQISSNF